MVIIVIIMHTKNQVVETILLRSEFPVDCVERTEETTGDEPEGEWEEETMMEESREPQSEGKDGKDEEDNVAPSVLSDISHKAWSDLDEGGNNKGGPLRDCQGNDKFLPILQLGRAIDDW